VSLPLFRHLQDSEKSNHLKCKENICSHIITKLRRENAAAVNTIFFDLSTTRFCGAKSPLSEWGRSKDGYDYHAVLALLVTEDGFPLYWDVLKGGTHDTHTLSWLVKKVGNRYPVGNMTLVFDRGMVSDILPHQLKPYSSKSYQAGKPPAAHHDNDQ
jgi:transposase